MTDDAEAPSAAPEAGPGRARMGRGLLVLAIGALVVAVGAAALALGQSGEVDDLRADRDDRREVALVASEFGRAYLSYDFDDVDASSDAVVALATDDFAERFEATSAPGIEELFASMETSTVATTDEVFVGDIEGDRARALVVVDVKARSTTSGAQDLSDLSFVLDLVKVDGRWLVDAVAPAPQPDISDGAGGPTTTAPAGATTTTAAPAP